MKSLLLLIGVVAVVWFWMDTLRARERALRAGSKACRQLNMQFLDQTVALSRFKFRRNNAGRVRVQRTYRFEFSDDGMHRWAGRVAVFDGKIESVELDHPDGTTYT
jgi:hypothetical protein